MIAWQCTQCAIAVDQWALGLVAFSLLCVVLLRWRGWDR